MLTAQLFGYTFFFVNDENLLCSLICTSNSMLVSAIDDKFDSGNTGSVLISRVLNHQLIPFSVRPKNSSCDQNCCEQFQNCCCNFTVLSPFIDFKKQRPQTYLEKCYQYRETSLRLKICFSLVTRKIND